jgi:hypothetical protein
MKRWIPIAIFALAILVFFIAGRLDSSRRNAAIQQYSASVRTEARDRAAGKSIAPPRQGIPAPAQTTAPASEPSPETSSVMAIVITVIFGVAGLWMVITKSPAIDDERRRWALGTLGIIIGYWLKS